MSNPNRNGRWVVFFDGDEARVYATERVARFMESSAANETAGNVHARAIPVALALAAPDMLAALEAVQAACRGHIPKTNAWQRALGMVTASVRAVSVHDSAGEQDEPIDPRAGVPSQAITCGRCGALFGTCGCEVVR